MSSYSVVSKDNCNEPAPPTFSLEITNFSKQQKQPPEVFCKKVLLKISQYSLHRKTPVLESLLIKLQTFRQLPSALPLYQKETPTQMFSVNIAKFLRTPSLKNILRTTVLKQLFFRTLYFRNKL